MQSNVQCSMCSSMTSLRCTTCEDITYCSKTCEKADRPVHKLVCRRHYPEYSDYPTYTGILFPDNVHLPQFVSFKGRSYYEARGCYYEDYHPVYLVLKRQPALSLTITGNVLRSRARVDSRILLYYDNKTPADVNRSIITVTSGQMAQNWYGPVLAVRVEGSTSDPIRYGTMTMTDLRDVVDFLYTFPVTNISDKTSLRIPASASPKAETTAARINCPGDQGCGRPKFEVIRIRADDAACSAPVTGISRLIDFPLRVVRCSPPYAPDYGDVNHVVINMAATYLNIGVDLEKDWSFVGVDWIDPAGSVIVVREKGEPLSTQHLEAMCHWCQYVLKPLFDDSRALGLRPEKPMQKTEVLARITKREFEDFYIGFDQWKGDTDSSWVKSNWPYEV